MFLPGVKNQIYYHIDEHNTLMRTDCEQIVTISRSLVDLHIHAICRVIGPTRTCFLTTFSCCCSSFMVRARGGGCKAKQLNYYQQS
jgi:hypothetical protein